MPTTISLPNKSESSEPKPVASTRLINNITFFGDSAIPEGDEFYESTYQAAKLLAENDYAIVNGGGPGIMKAATDGAESVDGHTIAVYWEPKAAAFFEGKNLANIVDESQASSNYLMRTFGLIENGDVYVVCKGGTGTISEFGMVWALAKLYYGSHKPVILYGEFWDELIAAFQKAMILDEVELSVLYRADTPKELLHTIQLHERKLIDLDIKKVSGDEKAFVLGQRESSTGIAAVSKLAVPKEIAGSTKSVDSVGSTKLTQSTQASDYQATMSNLDLKASEQTAKYAGRLVSQEQLDEFMTMVNPPAKVLDIGTGPGHDAKYLSQRYSVTCIEQSPRFYRIAKFENPELEIINADVLNVDLPTNTYKGIWARDALHFIPAPIRPELFTKLGDMLVTGGVLYMIVREGEGSIWDKYEENNEQDRRKIYQFTTDVVTDLAKMSGFKLQKIDHTKRSHQWLVAALIKE